jgi:hypothetical protein
MLISGLLLVVAIFAVVVILANLAERRAEWRGPLQGALLTLNILFAINYGLAEGGTPFTSLLAIGFGGAATLLLMGPVRVRLAAIFPPRRANAQGETVGFDPASPLHMTALVLCLYLLGNTVLSYALAGGLSGLAEEFRAPTGGGMVPEVLSPGSLLAQMAVFVLFGALGVGLGTRRTLSATLERLGLRAPTLREIGGGMGMAFLLFWSAFLVGSMWQMLVPPDMLQEQTELSGLIAGSIDTMSMAFMVALTAAVGEEIAFRGALQPVFGLWPTAALFVLTHIQYTLTPAALVILIVALGFGWVRRRYNTTAAIAAHFFYNAALLAIAVYGQYIFDMLDMLQWF